MEKKDAQGQLVRQIGLVSAIVFVMSSVIGTGVFKKIAAMSASLESPKMVLLAWLVAGLITLAGALSNAEVASMLVDSGGEYVYFRKIYNKFFAFMFGWANFAVIRTASIASIAYVFAQSVNSIFVLPPIAENLAQINIFGLFPFDNFSVKLVAIALILFLTYFNYRGLKLGESLSRILVAIMVISMLLIIILGLSSDAGSWQNLTTNSIKHHTEVTPGSFFKIMAMACLSAFWAYEGWASVGFIGGEIKNPQRNLPLAIVFGSLGIMVIYMLMNLVYLYILPIDKFIDIYESKNGIAAVEVVKSFGGKWGSFFISALILITTFNCTSMTILLAARLFYKMASEKVFFKQANFIHPQYNTPSNALFIQAIWSSLLVLSGTFDTLTDMLIFAAFIFYGATTLGVFILRKKMPDTPRPYKAWGYPVVPAIFIVFCIALIINTIIEKPAEALTGLGLIATGIPFYLYWNRGGKQI
jgi:basic amino acid/polyamine antiporter, APA family